jgi:formylglycine-generating enzyme required for sulfatase activity
MMRSLLLLLTWTAATRAQSPEFVKIPPGKLGDTVFERPFEMMRTEVTVAHFREFTRATGYVTSAEKAGQTRTWKNPGFKTSQKQPVVYVSPQDGSAYCAWVGARLPEDAEWEYAARAGTATRHYWGDEIDGQYLWFRNNSNDTPHPVARKKPNAWGLFDVEGNVWEWSLAGVDQNGERLAKRRGGSWVDCEYIEAEPGRKNSVLISLSNGYKIPIKLEHRYDDIGFRCARSPAK